MRQALQTMTEALSGLSGGRLTALYLYGSAAMDDFRPGWSDVDVLCLLEAPPTEAQAASLVTLRQRLVEETGDPLYRGFEGAIVALPEFLAGRYSRVIYWGTSGERIADRYDFDAFSRVSLIRYGKLLAGREVRDRMALPTEDELRAAVARHLATIRQAAARTGPSLYACGWLLDISRCLYTLRAGDILPKTAAGEWALQAGLCPVEEDLRRALVVRREPLKYRDDPDTVAWLIGLAPSIQRYADTLERELTQR